MSNQDYEDSVKGLRNELAEILSYDPTNPKRAAKLWAESKMKLVNEQQQRFVLHFNALLPKQPMICEECSTEISVSMRKIKNGHQLSVKGTSCMHLQAAVKGLKALAKKKSAREAPCS